ncbi:MAG: hypothetical protein IJY25_05160 [Bacilli bacterium]|nr:hypothetical protein [Bacilli bacterium]
MNYSYLIPANSKKSMLIFGVFNTVDMIIFGCGLGVSLLLMMFLPVDQFWIAILAISPGLITGFLVLPIPNYHNVRTVIKNAWNFYTTRQRYIWKGWCFEYGERNKK